MVVLLLVCTNDTRGKRFWRFLAFEINKVTVQLAFEPIKSPTRAKEVGLGKPAGSRLGESLLRF